MQIYSKCMTLQIIINKVFHERKSVCCMFIDYFDFNVDIYLGNLTFESSVCTVNMQYSTLTGIAMDVYLCNICNNIRKDKPT